MAVITYRQALHDTLRAELQRDENVFLMGEEIGVFEGSYKITAGLLAEFGAKRVRDTPIAEEGFVGAAIGAAMLGLRPVVEIMTINFILLAHRPDRQPRRQDPRHVRRPGQVPHGASARPAAAASSLAATHSQNLEVWYAHVPGLKVRGPERRRPSAKALLTRGHPRRRPGASSWRTWRCTTPRARCRTASTVAEIGKAAVVKSGHRHHRRRATRAWPWSRARTSPSELARRRAIGAEVVDLRSLRPLDRETICRVGPQDQPRRRLRGRLAHLRHRRRDRGDDPGGRLRLPRRAGAAGRGGRGAAAVRQAAGARRPAVGGRPARRWCRKPSTQRGSRVATQRRRRHGRSDDAPALRHDGGGRRSHAG